MDSIKDKHTKALKNRLNKNRQESISAARYATGDELVYLEKERTLLKEELKTRPHVNNKKQNDLIRRMNQKAGKRLTLQEAQLLNNKISK